jgi:hypothetical protein
MGLDMYLYRRTYIGAKYEHNDAKVEVDISLMGERLKIDPKRLTYIYEEMGYWRKANAIHGWFVDNFAQGDDDCQQIHVSANGLKRLLDICRKVMALRDNDYSLEQLPPKEGFFFGGNQIDEYYWQTIEETQAILEDILKTHNAKHHEYIYQASW